MSLLLDTHIWIWSLFSPERLVPNVRRVLQDPASDLWLSPISPWEFLLLMERGRMRPPGGGHPDSWVAHALAALPLREAPVTHAIARASREVALPHQDPADRFLVATARVLDLQLVTADARIIKAGACEVLPNTR